MMPKYVLKDIAATDRESIVSKEQITLVGDAVRETDRTILIKEKGGFQTQHFISAASKVIANIKCISQKPLTIRIGYMTDDGSCSFEGISTITNAPDEEGAVNLWKGFDAAWFAVYRQAVRFFAQVDCEEENELRILDIKVWDYSEMERMDIYADDLESMMFNVERKINHEAYMAAHNTEPILVSPNGKKFILHVDDEGNLSAKSLIPKKVLFIGNSLLLGMGHYGMCASSPKEDYCYYVSEAIRKRNPDVQIEKLHGAPFEALENPAGFDELWNVKINHYTGRPMKESFQSDLDLIVIQLGDNVNNEKRRQTFEKTIELFIQKIKQSCPKARIIWVHGFFNKQISGRMIEDACSRWRIGQIGIGDFNTRNNLGKMMQEYELPDGTKGIVENLWIGHPGNEGMQAIADRIIAYLKI